MICKALSIHPLPRQGCLPAPSSPLVLRPPQRSYLPSNITYPQEIGTWNLELGSLISDSFRCARAHARCMLVDQFSAPAAVGRYLPSSAYPRPPSLLVTCRREVLRKWDPKNVAYNALAIMSYCHYPYLTRASTSLRGLGCSRLSHNVPSAAGSRRACSLNQRLLT